MGCPKVVVRFHKRLAGLYARCHSILWDGRFRRGLVYFTWFQAVFCESADVIADQFVDPSMDL